MKKLNLLGQKFGRLTVIENLESENGRSYSLCLCDCGKTKPFKVMNKYLRNHHVVSCGCVKSERISGLGKKTGKEHITKAHEVAWENNKTHQKSKTRLYRIWQQMKQRCSNPNCDAYKYYGHKGVSLCEEWNNNFISFYEWSIQHGYKNNLTIDRIDSNKNYCPENCRWLTQADNTRRVFHPELVD